MPLHRLTCAAALFATVVAADLPPALHAQDQPPTFRGSTTVVEVDVIVRDGKRRFVADLTVEDFEVRDEGVPREISALYRVIGPGDASAGLANGAEPSPLPAPPPQQVRRVVVLYFDQPHMQPGSVDRARGAALAFLKDDFREGDVGGIVVGDKMLNNRLTDSRGELEAAVRTIRPAPELAMIERDRREWPVFVNLTEAYRVTRKEGMVLGDVLARACNARPEDCSGLGREWVEANIEHKAVDLVSRARVLAQNTLRTLETLAAGLARLPGRKTVIFLCDGFFTEDLWGEVRSVVSRAARASVRIYALDTRGLNRGSASSDIITQEAPNAPGALAAMQSDTASDGPNSLAVDTGGYVIRNENDFGKAFAEIDRDTSSYYVVGFRTTQPPDGKFHTLSVRVKRSGVTVRARKGYIASAAPAPEAAAPASGEVAAAPVSPIAPVAPPSPPAANPVTTGVAVPNAGTTPAGVVRLTPRRAAEIETIGGGAISPTANSSLPAALRKRAAEGWDAYQKGDVESARDALQGVVGQQGAPPWTHYVLGWSLVALGEGGPAGVSWEKVRAAVPQFEPVYFDLGDVYQRQGEFGKAIAVLRDAVARWPADVEVYSALGVVQLARGAVDDAIATFAKGVAVAPKDANVCYNLAKTYEVRYVRAARMRKLGPDSAASLSGNDDRNQAIMCYQKVVALGGPLTEQAKEGLKRLGQ